MKLGLEDGIAERVSEGNHGAATSDISHDFIRGGVRINLGLKEKREDKGNERRIWIGKGRERERKEQRKRKSLKRRERKEGKEKKIKREMRKRKKRTRREGKRKKRKETGKGRKG